MYILLGPRNETLFECERKPLPTWYFHRYCSSHVERSLRMFSNSPSTVLAKADVTLPPPSPFLPSSPPPTFLAQTSTMSKPIIHIVAFAYKPDTPTSYKSSLAASFLALKAECVSEKDGRNYIKSMTAGKQNSPEGAHLGFEVGPGLLRWLFSLCFPKIKNKQNK